MVIDTSQTINVRASVVRCLLPPLLVAMLAIGAVAMFYFRLIPLGNFNNFRINVVFGFVLSLPVLNAIVLYYSISAMRRSITITQTGLTDTRFGQREIPWRVISGIETWSHEGSRHFLLKVDREFEATLEPTAAINTGRYANSQFGTDGLWLNLGGMQMAQEALLATILAYLQVHGASSTASPSLL